MTNSAWHPYAPDQEFGVRVAADQDTLDRLVAELDARPRPAPRPANKAPLAGQPPGRSSASWIPLFAGDGDPLAGPVSLATILGASAELRADG
jgi:hypothetical protein